MPEAKKKIVEKKEKSQRLLTRAPSAAKKAGKYIFAVGRRKESIALVRLYHEKGSIVVNGKTLAEYFPQLKLQETARLPFAEVKADPLRVEAKVRGGGIVGQAEAVRLGIARALAESDKGFRARLRATRMLTRDARVKERRKYGLKKARRAPQWAKR